MDENQPKQDSSDKNKDFIKTLISMKSDVISLLTQRKQEGEQLKLQIQELNKSLIALTAQEALINELLKEFNYERNPSSSTT